MLSQCNGVCYWNIKLAYNNECEGRLIFTRDIRVPIYFVSILSAVLEYVGCMLMILRKKKRPLGNECS